MHAEPVGWVTGEASPNPTGSRWGVDGTDLGICWDDGQGGVLVAFGDTFDPRAPSGGGGGGDWRSNVIARSTDRDLAGGMTLDWFATDRPDHAREVLGSRKVDGVEMTTIPTGGVAVGARQYLAFMSVRRWGEPGRWRTNHAGIAHSDDGGATWVKPSGREGPTWANNRRGGQPFQMNALVRHEGHVLLFGTPNGRAGACHLARAPEDGLLDLSSYERWDGQGWRAAEPPPRRRWGFAARAGEGPLAAEVLPAPVSELSVMHHRRSEQWLAAHYREDVNAVVVHTAGRPTGPWSAPVPVATAADFPGLYGAFWHPWTADAEEPMFLMSQWGPYNVRLMRLRGVG